MSNLKIIQHPNKILRMKCEPVPEINKHIEVGAHTMISMMRQFGGIGLAAPQIGWPVRIFIHRAAPGSGLFGMKEGEPRVYINPEISWASEDTYWDLEECLSIPWSQVQVERCKSIRVKAKNLQGQIFEDICRGFQARVIQHEIDHLDGILILDKGEHVSSWQKVKKDVDTNSDDAS